MNSPTDVTILFFSLFRDLTGSESMRYELPESEITLEELVLEIYEKIPALKEWDGRMLLAVNHEYADRTQVVRQGDEIAMMPPVQGG